MQREHTKSGIMSTDPGAIPAIISAETVAALADSAALQSTGETVEQSATVVERAGKLVSNSAQLARMYLCVPATSAPSERVFSVASRIISKLRARLTPANAGMLIFLSGTVHNLLPITTPSKRISI